MQIRKHEVKEVVSPVSLGLGRELAVGTLLVCLKGGRSPVMALQYEGRYVKMEISSARLRGNVRSGSLKLLPEALVTICGLDVPKQPIDVVKPGMFASFTKAVRAGSKTLPAGSLVKVITTRGGTVVARTLINEKLVEVHVPGQILEVAAPVDERSSALNALHPVISLNSQQSVGRLAYEGIIHTPRGQVSVACDGERGACITGMSLDYLSAVVAAEVLRVGGQAEQLGRLIERYVEFAATVQGLMTFSEYLHGLLAKTPARALRKLIP